MAFALDAIVGSTTYSLSDGAPYSIESVDGLGVAPVQRYTQTAPLQDGATDLGYNLTARAITLALNFKATDDSTLDGYRDDLTSIFKPNSGGPVKLRITRDDGNVRQIDTYATDGAIACVATDRPGHLHRAVIQLRAANPAWYDPAPGTATLTLPDANWWLGAGAIGTASVLEHIGTPAPGTAWDWAGTATQLTIVWRMAGSIPPGNQGAYKYAWTSGTADDGTVRFFAANDDAESYTAFSDSLVYLYKNGDYYDSITPPGTITSGSVYKALMFHGTSVGISSSFSYTTHILSMHDASRSIGLHGYTDNTSPTTGTAIAGGGHWGGDGAGTSTQWPGTITHAAIYSGWINDAQVRSIAFAIDSGTLSNRQVALGYTGNVYEYPVITVTGPIANPVISNVTTGEVLDFTGATVPAGVTYTIDLSASPIAVTDSGGTVRTALLTDDSTLGTWAIAPHPIAQGGTNLITLAGTSIGTATAVNVVYYNRYMSY